MSTRANIIIKDGHDQLIFYRHSDGYPQGVKPTLSQFLKFVKEGNIRSNVGQAAGWLIILGHRAYVEDGLCVSLPTDDAAIYQKWKVGAYEPTTCIHGDIEYLYEIDLQAQTLKGWHYRDEKLAEVNMDAD